MANFGKKVAEVIRDDMLESSLTDTGVSDVGKVELTEFDLGDVSIGYAFPMKHRGKQLIVIVAWREMS